MHRLVAGNKTFHARSLNSLLLITVFLVLGFCPLRNALCQWVQREPARTTAKVPVYGKIIAQDDCTGAVVIPGTVLKERPLDGPPLIFCQITTWLSQPLLTWNRSDGIIPATPVSYSLPLYLRNRSLRI